MKNGTVQSRVKINEGEQYIVNLSKSRRISMVWLYYLISERTCCVFCIFFLQCMVCCQARSVMQVSPCGHQALCRLCFVHNIQEAVAARDLPLKCLLCGAKIIRVKNNSKAGQGTDHPVHVGIGSRVKRMPKSVSGYSLCATSENEENKKQSGIAQSQSSYSMSSGKELSS